MDEEIKKYIVEMIGTFFLVFTVGATSVFGGSGVIAPIAVGFILMVMIYAGGYISGGHYNPAVSLAAVIRGALPGKMWIGYAASQFFGGFAAAYIINFMAGGAAYTLPIPYDIANVIIAEFLFTFALCYVVLLTATSKKTEGNSYYGLAIGATVTVGAFAVGTICLGAFNPAVALSTIILGTAGCIKIAWLTAFINLLAGVAAAVVFNAIDAE